MSDTDDIAARLRSAAEYQADRALYIHVAKADVLALLDEREKLRAALERLRCEGCGMTPTDPTWLWCEPVPGYMDAHVVGIMTPDYCGPVTFRAALGTTEGEI